MGKDRESGRTEKGGKEGREKKTNHKHPKNVRTIFKTKTTAAPTTALITTPTFGAPTIASIELDRRTSSAWNDVDVTSVAGLDLDRLLARLVDLDFDLDVVCVARDFDLNPARSLSSSLRSNTSCAASLSDARPRDLADFCGDTVDSLLLSDSLSLSLSRSFPFPSLTSFLRTLTKSPALPASSDNVPLLLSLSLSLWLSTSVSNTVSIATVSVTIVVSASGANRSSANAFGFDFTLGLKELGGGLIEDVRFLPCGSSSR